MNYWAIVPWLASMCCSPRHSVAWGRRLTDSSALMPLKAKASPIVPTSLEPVLNTTPSYAMPASKSPYVQWGFKISMPRMALLKGKMGKIHYTSGDLFTQWLFPSRSHSNLPQMCDLGMLYLRSSGEWRREACRRRGNLWNRQCEQKSLLKVLGKTYNQTYHPHYPVTDAFCR